MAAYYILTHTVTDIDRYLEEYIPKAAPFVAKYGGEDPQKSVVVIRFPSEQHVRDFVNDPEYQPIKEIRLALTTSGNAVLAPEFQMPEG